MKPLLATVVAICLAIASALPQNIEDVKELPQSKEPIVEAEASEPQTRNERCTTCSGSLKLNLNSPNEILAKIQSIPGAEVHTQQSFEGCSSDKGCAGIKVKDGQVIERFGNVDSFKAAAASDTANEFTFHTAGSFGANNVFEGGIPNGGPFWWMNQDSPFKSGGGNFEKFSKSSSFSSTGNTGATGAGAAGLGGASFSGSIDLSANPFLNGDFSKVAGGFASSGQEVKPSTFQSSSFESSSFSSSNKGENDARNSFQNAGANKFGGAGFQAQGSFGSGQGFGQNQGFASQGSQGAQFSSGNKFSGYTGSSPSPFTASTSSNVNLIQNGQKSSEFDFEQQQQTQQNIDEIFQGTGNVHAHEHSGGELQQTCAGQGYVCVHKAQCNNGVVNTNGAGILQARTKKQYCNIKTEICCRIEISTVSGGGGLQGSLGVGSATYSGSGSQGSGLFVSSQGSQSGSSGSGQSSFGQGSKSGSSGSGQSSFGQGSQSGSSGSGQSSFGQGSGQGSFGAGQGSFESSSSSFGSSSTFGNSNRGSGTQGSGFGVSGSFGSNGASGSFGSTGASGTSGSNGVSGSFGQGSNAFGQGGSVNRGVTVDSSSSSFESRGTSFNSGAGSSGNANGGKFGVTGSFGTNFGSTAAPGVTASRFGSGSGNEVVYKQTSQTNFVESDSFSSGSENTGQVYRPGQTGLKPGIPYLPPVDSSNSGSSVVSSTAFPTTFSTPRPFTTPRPTYLPPVPSTSAPGYLPPQVPEQSINTETRVPIPRPDTEGGIILDETRPRPTKAPAPFSPNDIPAGCAAALKCTPIEHCTAEGVMTNTTVVLTRDQEAYRVPLTDCKDLETGRIGKCCRDPFYTDPWPTNQLGKWVPGVFGGNDGKYNPDSRGSGSIVRPQVTARPPVTGSIYLNNLNTPKPTLPPFGPNQVTPGFPATTLTQNSYAQKGQFEVRGQGQIGQGGQGQFAQGSRGQIGIGSQGQSNQFGQGSQFTSSSTSFNQVNRQTEQDQGQIVTQGQGQFGLGGRGQIGIGGLGQIEIQAGGAQGQFAQTSQTRKGFGQTVTQGQGQTVTQGQGQSVRQGQGQLVRQGQGQFGISGQGQTEFTSNVQGGQTVVTGQDQSVSQGFGTGVRQGQGFEVRQGGGFNVENEYSESVQRVFLQQYSAGGQCGLLNGQKPYGNRNELEVDFAEIPWQAMVLLQTNKSLLCGGVITRPDVVITSAACVDGLEARNVLIKGGEWKLGIDDEPLPFQIVQVKTILRHPSYKRGSLLYDAAILVLSENLRLAKNIYPICLPRAGDTLDAFYNGAGECVVTGWGKQVLQAHLAGSIMHSLNVSLINPGECQAKLSQDYPHLLEQYDQESCACGQPTNPVNNICRVDIGSALACNTGDNHFVLRGIYSWDSGCQPGNQLAAFYKFDLEWYEWAIGLIESARFAQYSSGSTILSQNRFAGQINNGLKGGLNAGVKGGYKGFGQGQFSSGQGQFSSGQGQFSSGQGQFSSGQKFSQFSSAGEAAGLNFGAEVKGPITNSFSATFSEKKIFQSEPKIVTYTTKPEIVTFTTKPEYFTYTTKPKIVTYTTKPQIITYETSGSGTNPQYVAPGVTFNPSFSALVGKGHTHNAQCKCLENGKK